MAVQSVELVNDYEVDVKEGTFKLVKSNRKFFDLLSEDDVIESDADILVSDLIEACESLNIDFEDYLKKIDVIKIILEDNSELYITNLDIARIWDWHEYYEEMSCNWYGNYIMVTAADEAGESGIMAIYDVSEKGWIFGEEEPYMRGMIYAPETDKFIGFYDIYSKNYKGCGLYIIDPEKGFEKKSVVFEGHGIAKDFHGNNVISDESNHVYELTDEAVESDDFTGCLIDEKTALLWNGKERCCYAKKGDMSYRFCF